MTHDEAVAKAVAAVMGVAAEVFPDGPADAGNAEFYARVVRESVSEFFHAMVEVRPSVEAGR